MKTHLIESKSEKKEDTQAEDQMKPQNWLMEKNWAAVPLKQSTGMRIHLKHVSFDKKTLFSTILLTSRERKTRTYMLGWPTKSMN